MFSCETPTQQTGNTQAQQPTVTNPEQPDTVQPPVTNHKIALGVTFGNQIDHYTSDMDVPIYGRQFYYKSKDKPNGIPFKDYDFVPLVDLKMPVGIGWDSTMAENAFRVEKASNIFSQLSVSLEEVLDLNGDFHPFPFKDTPYDQYGSNEREVTAKVSEYIEAWLITHGKRVERLELGNEPWGYEKWQWKVIERAAINTWKAFDGPKPLLASAAVPVGQGRDGDLASFFNLDLIDNYSVITGHLYPIEHGKFLTDKDAIIALMIKQIDILMDFHAKYAPHTDVHITETGVPIQLDDEWFYKWMFDYCYKYEAIKVIFAYNYQEIPTPPFDNMHMVDSNKKNTPTFDYLLTNFN